MKLLTLFALGMLSASSQPLTFGVKGGVPLTDFLNAVSSPGVENATSTTNPYIVGPTLEVHLPANLAMEFDALFRHYRYQTRISPIGFYERITTTSNAWEFPLLLKYKLPGQFVRPCLDGGVAWDHLQGLSATRAFAAFNVPTPTTTPVPAPPELQKKTSTGIVIGGGVEIHALFLRVSPEIRYTRWTSQHFTAVDLLGSNQSQAEFLLGITIRSLRSFSRRGA